MTVAYSYRSLGLVSTTELFAKAIRGGYAVPAYNFNNLEQVQAITAACAATESPVILQAGTGALAYSDYPFVMRLAQAAVEYAGRLGKGKGIPIALHLDHGDTFERCVRCIEWGFSSVMIDGSHLPYEENVELTRKTVQYAHARGAAVEGELGVLAGAEDDIAAPEHVYTRPEEAADFVARTGCDSLAIAIGTSHGAYKFKPGQKASLRHDILADIEQRLPGFPIVLHGASSVPPETVEKINSYGGRIADARGIPESELRRAAASAVCKINVDSDGRLALTAAMREMLAQDPAEFDPRKILGPAREAVRELYMFKNRHVFGSAGHAFD